MPDIKIDVLVDNAKALAALRELKSEVAKISRDIGKTVSEAVSGTTGSGSGASAAAKSALEAEKSVAKERMATEDQVARHKFRMGQMSAQQYRDSLQSQIAATEEGTVKRIALEREAANLSTSIQREVDNKAIADRRRAASEQAAIDKQAILEKMANEKQAAAEQKSLDREIEAANKQAARERIASDKQAASEQASIDRQSAAEYKQYLRDVSASQKLESQAELDAIKEANAEKLQANRAYLKELRYNTKNAMLDAADAEKAKSTQSEARGRLGNSLVGDLPLAGMLPNVVGSGMLGAAGMTAIGLGAATEQYAKLQAMLVTTRNNTKMTDEEFAHMKTTVMSVAKESGADIEDVAKGYMHISNLAIQGADATKLLTVAMESAVATGSSVSDTAEILAKSMKNFNIPVVDAAKAMNVLHLAAAEGNMTLQQFDEAAGPGLAVAASLGANLTETAAAMSALTRAGFNAAQATTQVRDVFQHLVHQTKGTKEELDKLSHATGINLTKDFTAAGLKGRGLFGIFQDLARATKGHADEVYKLIPALRGGQGAMILSSVGAKNYSDILGDLNKAMGGQLTPTQDGYNEKSKQLDQQQKKLANSAMGLYSVIGTRLVPVFIDLVNWATRTVDGFNKLSPGMQSVIVYGAALTTGLVLLGGAGYKGVVAFAELKTALQEAGLFMGATKVATEGLAAGEAATTVATGALATGLRAAFLTGGPIALGITALLGLVGGGVYVWNQLKDAQDQATDSLQRYADMKKNLVASQNPHDQLIGNIANIQDTRNQIKNELDTPPLPYVTATPRLRAQYDTRHAQLQKDYDAQTAQLNIAKSQLHEMNTGGYSTEKRAFATVGADGFAKSVGDHLFDNIVTPKNVASCAYFVSDVFKKAGAPDIPQGGIGSTNALIAWAKAHGATPHGQDTAMPGDMVAFTGKRFGAGGSGHHVGIYMGGDSYRESSNGHIKTGSLSGDMKWGAKGGNKDSLAFYTIPGSTFSATTTPTAPYAMDGGPATTADAVDTTSASFTTQEGRGKSLERRFNFLLSQYQRTGDKSFLHQALALIPLMKQVNIDIADAKDKAESAKAEASKKGDHSKGKRSAEYLNSVAEINDDMAKKREGILDQLNLTPKERDDLSHDLTVTQLQTEKQKNDSEIAKLKYALGNGGGSLGDYGKISDLTNVNAMLDVKIAKTTADKSKEGDFKDHVTNAELAKSTQEINNKLAVDQVAIEKEKNEWQTKQYENAVATITVENDKLNIGMKSETNDEKRKATLGRIYANEKAIAVLHEKQANISSDPAVVAGRHNVEDVAMQNATLNYHQSLAEIYTREAEIYHAQADATVDLTQKRDLNIKAMEAETKAAEENGDVQTLALKKITDPVILADMQHAIDLRKTSMDVFNAFSTHDKKGATTSLDAFRNLVMNGDDIARNPGDATQYIDAIQEGVRSRSLDKRGPGGAESRLRELQKQPGIDPTTADSIQKALDSFKTAPIAETISKEMGAGLAQAGDVFMRDLFDKKKHKFAFDQLGKELMSVGENSLMKSIFNPDKIGSFLMNVFKGGKGGADMFKGIPNLFKSAKGSMLDGAAGIYGAAAMLGAMGKQKQKHSIFGAVLGAAAGFFMSGGNPMGALKGAQYGSAIGGMFANGGSPPMGVPSIVGERGPELFVPSVPGMIIPNHQMNKMMGGGGMNINLNNHYSGDIHHDVDLEKHSKRQAFDLEKVLRMGVAATGAV